MNSNYEVLKNRLENGIPYSLTAALARIDALADNLQITQEQADELTAIARANATPPNYEERIASLEQQIEKIITGDVEEPETDEPVTDDGSEEVPVNE